MNVQLSQLASKYLFVSNNSELLKDFHEILYLGRVLKFVCTFTFWLKDHNTNKSFTWRTASISTNVSSNSLNIKCSQNTSKHELHRKMKRILGQTHLRFSSQKKKKKRSLGICFPTCCFVGHENVHSSPEMPPYSNNMISEHSGLSWILKQHSSQRRC